MGVDSGVVLDANLGVDLGLSLGVDLDVDLGVDLRVDLDLVGGTLTFSFLPQKERYNRTQMWHSSSGPGI